MSYIPKINDPVIFGRKNGERTKGTVMRVNRTKAKVRQDETRGLQKSHEVGTVWTVPFNLLTLDDSRTISHPVTRERHTLLTKKHEGRDLIQVIMDLEDEVLREQKRYRDFAESF